MKTTLFLLISSLLILAAGCGKEDSSQVSSASPAAAPDPYSSAGQAVPITEEPPPLVPVLSDSPVEKEGPGLLKADGSPMDDLEKLNYALRAYAARQLPEPRGFEDLVRAGFLRSVPVPPPGKKYVIDVNTISVKLVDAQ